MRAHLDKIVAQKSYYPGFEQISMAQNSGYNRIVPTYLCELIIRRESYVNTWLGADHH